MSLLCSEVSRIKEPSPAESKPNKHPLLQFSRSFTDTIVFRKKRTWRCIWTSLYLAILVIFPLSTFPKFLNKSDFCFLSSSLSWFQVSIYVQALNYTLILWTAWIFMSPDWLCCVLHHAIRAKVTRKWYQHIYPWIDSC